MTLKTPQNDSFSALAKEFRDRLKGQQDILVTTHTSPDGDGVASALAGVEILRLLGSEAVFCLSGDIPERYKFLPGSDRVINWDISRDKKRTRALVVDCGSYARIGALTDAISPDAELIVVDHHADNTRFGQLNIIHPECASTTQILFKLIRELELPVDKKLADLLFTGLLTDTGGFRFSNADEEAFSTATELVKFGAHPHKIAEEVYSSNSLKSINILSDALRSLELHANGRVALMTVKNVNADEEPEDLSDYALWIKGVQASALFRLQDKLSRVSLRSRGSVKVDSIAHSFGGGGHPKAAGFTITDDSEVVKTQVIKALSEEVDKRYPHTANQE
ncbi:hypothetical protein CEE37_03780 [candidate division LCP-89 bacterium B3_LCP]|uniref:Uncharacterized protein n=1 Tax=candidate division LCP-89 bacterium B3_LCP TaxID=2012998 RepID=A0A532V3A2_UNCL8|nr:MAG: hypothetical protein CEE37_03780 [candidate division LCP-89 bacterium B3_LCP]